MPVRWADVAAFLRGHEVGAFVRLPAWGVEHPRDAGMLPAITLPVGQRGEYRLDVGDGHDLVVSDFIQCYDAHLECRPALADFERLLRDAPGTSVVGLIAVGALVGLALGRSKESALAGAAIGGIAALAGVAVANADGKPAISDVASKLLSTMTPIGPELRVASTHVHAIESQRASTRGTASRRRAPRSRRMG